MSMWMVWWWSLLINNSLITDEEVAASRARELEEAVGRMVPFSMSSSNNSNISDDSPRANFSLLPLSNSSDSESSGKESGVEWAESDESGKDEEGSGIILQLPIILFRFYFEFSNLIFIYFFPFFSFPPPLPFPPLFPFLFFLLFSSLFIPSLSFLLTPYIHSPLIAIHWSVSPFLSFSLPFSPSPITHFLLSCLFLLLWFK